jgi:2-polyprenyl-3-methyl-5-hydroxy-6-metoxy-1,4-benzoquinol methylase
MNIKTNSFKESIMSDIPVIQEFYDRCVEGEWNRLSGFSFEYEVTKVKMMERIKSQSTILDIGGGPGRYAFHFASLGHDVTLVDLSTGNVAHAKKLFQEMNYPLKAYQADARDLSHLPLDTYDCIFVMGPLYHLREECDRKKVIEEAKKHLKPGGLIFVSFIHMFAGLNYYLSECPKDIILEKELDYFDCLIQGKSWYGNAFTKAFFVHLDEIIPFMDSCGLKKELMFGQEGISASNLAALTQLDEVSRNKWLEICLDLCDKEVYMSHSSHVMFIGSVKENV